jgi:hypothetical protein
MEEAIQTKNNKCDTKQRAYNDGQDLHAPKVSARAAETKRNRGAVSNSGLRLSGVNGQ